MHDHDEERRTEHNLFARSGQSEAELALGVYCRPTIKADRHEASRGLSVTAGLGLLVLFTLYTADGASVWTKSFSISAASVWNSLTRCLITVNLRSVLAFVTTLFTRHRVEIVSSRKQQKN